MKHRIVFRIALFSILGVLLGAINASAQSIAYRRSNLASNLPGVANNITPGVVNPWGMAFLSDQPFFIADNQAGRVTVHDATGLGVAPAGFIVPNSVGTGFDTPTGIVADQGSFFGSPSLIQPFILVTEQGSILTWGPDAQGNFLSNATVVRKRAGAVYKGVAILDSLLTAPVLAVADFRGGFIETFLPGFAAVATPGSFTDPDLPAGYMPFGIQVIGRQVFVAYALQDAATHDPVVGAGNGIVSIFDMDGNFLRRFATGGQLNAPWGITQASADFGPFSNDILIGNVGDGTINAFDPASGQFVGQLLDGDGVALVEVGLHGLAVRADGFGDRNTLYFTSQINNESDGLFGGITTGLVSLIRPSAPDATVDASVTITAGVAAGPGNLGTPTGTVTFLDGTRRLGTAAVVAGSVTLDTTFTVSGIHTITAQYSGDSAFLPSSAQIPLQVTGLLTTLSLAVPPDAAPGATTILTATITSPGGLPTGDIAFLDGNTVLGSAPLDGGGIAVLRINTLAAGAHALTAFYAGDGKFGASTSAAVTINVASADFSIEASPASAAVVAGQSAQFMLTVTPAGGFANNVTFVCSPITGITCAFSPATITPADRAATSTLTVTTSATVYHYGLLIPNQLESGPMFVALTLLSLAVWPGRKLRIARASLLTAGAVAVVALGMSIAGCGGYGSTPSNRGTAAITVTAQSGAISHATTVQVTVE